MKFLLVFDKSGDELPFEAKYNWDIFEFFVAQANQKEQNCFSNHRSLYREVDKHITHLHWAISKTNEVLSDLIGVSFQQHNNLEDYLDQEFLNQTHCDWVMSQCRTVNIDQLRTSSDRIQAKIGNRLHELYPDEIRFPMIAAVLEKIGYIYPYEEVNMGVHRLESSFNKTNLEFKAKEKWAVFDNPFKDSFVSNNDVVNFSFGYTFVGRQYYNKFVNFDSNLKHKDHYNYEQLEFAFQLNVRQPETIAFSQEAVAWAQQQGIRLVAEQIPIGNLVDIENKLFDYRKILYRNSRDQNNVQIIL